MTHIARITDEAEKDLEEAAHWYEQRRPRLGHEFLDEFSVLLEALGRSPLTYPVVHRDIRRALLGKFPFVVFFRLINDELFVVAVLHGSRHPRKWKARF